MKQTSTLLMIVTCLTLALGACSNGQKPMAAEGLIVIDVEAAMDRLKDEFTLSDVADSVWYLPLETTDESLVGEHPYVQQAQGKLMVTASNGTLVFDGQTGRFLNTIGHQGEDPQGHSGGMPFYNEYDSLCYFNREPDQLQKYDLEGNYCGKIRLSNSQVMGMTTFCDSLIVGTYLRIPFPAPYMRLFDISGQLLDSVSLPCWPAPPIGKQMVYGEFTNDEMSQLILRFKDNSHWAYRVDVLGENEGRITYHPAYSDTLYAFNGHTMCPWVVLHTGKYHFPLEARTVCKGYSDQLVLEWISVTPTQIYFTCVRDVFGEEKPYWGIHDRQTGHTVMAPGNAEGYRDDQNGFMPIKLGLPNGLRVVLIEAYQIVDWLAEHPEARQNPAVAPLLKVQAEDNPVAVFVQCK